MKRTILCLFSAIYSCNAIAEPALVFNLETDIAGWSAPHSVSNQPANTISGLCISNLSVQVFLDDADIFAVARITTSSPDARSTWLSRTNDIALEAVSEDTYKWLPSEPKPGYPDLSSHDHFLIRFSGNTVLAANADHFGLAEQLSPAGSDDLLACTINVAPLIDPLFAALNNLIDEQEEGFLKAILGGALDGLKQSAQSVKEFPRVAMEIDTADDGQRNMDLSLEFNSPTLALVTQAFYSDAENAWKNPALTDIQLSLIKLAASPDFKGLERDGSTIHFRYDWPPERDQDMLKTLTGPLTDNLFSLAAKAGAEYPVNAEEIIPDPQLKTLTDFDAAAIEQTVRNVTFFAGQNRSDIQFVIDCLDIPNKSLLETSFTNVILTATNGVNAALKERPARFNVNRDDQSGRIYLKKESGAPPIETASFTLQIEVPVEIEKHTLSMNQPLYEKDGEGCCLIAISNSVAKIRSKDLSLREAKIYALNKDGEYISQDSSMCSPTIFSGTFKGLPASMEIVIPVRYETVSVEFTDLPVAKGTEIKMPKQPTNSIPVRYTDAGIPVYSDPDLEAFSRGTMTIETNAGRQKDQCILRFPKPAQTERRSIVLKTYLAGTDALIYEGKKNVSWTDVNNYNWWTSEGTLPTEATALFGELTTAFWRDIGNYTVDLSTNPVPLIEGRDEPVVSSEFNVVWVSKVDNEMILDVRAYDGNGRQLKRDYMTSINPRERGYHFWGQPVRTTVAYATGSVTSTVPFEIELKKGGLDAVPEAKAKASAFEAFLEEVKQIEKDTTRVSDLLAANYYWHNSVTKQPCAYIPLEIAQSDPLGAKIFGYEAKPYKGYYFRRIRKTGTNWNVSSYGWSGGSFEAGGQGYLLATPADPRMPSIMFLWGNIYINYKDCSQMEEIDTDSTKMKEAGWIQIR